MHVNVDELLNEEEYKGTRIGSLWRPYGISAVAVSGSGARSMEVTPLTVHLTFMLKETSCTVGTPFAADGRGFIVIHDPDSDGPVTVRLPDGTEIRGLAVITGICSLGCADLQREEAETLWSMWDGRVFDTSYRGGRIPRMEFCHRCGGLIPESDNMGMGESDPIDGERVCHRCCENMEYRMSVLDSEEE